jgi:hypothetical protein
MAVHRAHERGGQGIRDGYRWSGGAGDLSHILFPMGSGQWDRQKSAAVPPTTHRIGRHHPGMVGGIIPEWVGQVPKSRAPDSAERTGAPHVAQGGWGVVSATVVQS